MVRPPRPSTCACSPSAGATVLAALAFGVFPSLRACGHLDADSLRDGGRAGTGRGRARLRSLLVVAEVSVSVVLLVSSGLLQRAVDAAAPRSRLPPRTCSRCALVAAAEIRETAERAQFHDRVLAEARALPGVTGAAYTSFPADGHGRAIHRSSWSGCASRCRPRAR
jgi:hypothetical protein